MIGLVALSVCSSDGSEDAADSAHTVLDLYPAFTPNSVVVAPSGNIYVTSPADGNVYRILAG